MLQVKSKLIAAVTIWLAACAGDPTSSPGGRYAPGELLQGIEIDRIGQDRVGLREFQDRAMAKAVAFAINRGVARQRIIRITVDTLGGDVHRSLGVEVRRTPVSYTLWLRINGCESDVVFRASATGRIGAPRDRSGCLSAAEQPAQ
jgi:hypothetical protein